MPDRTIILGIESSCDETACAVADGREVLANIVASQIDLHARFGGVVPEIASRAHIEAVNTVIEQAMEAADVGPGQIAAVAVTHEPGLIGSLLVGLMAAKTLAWVWDKPLVGVNHVYAHAYAAALGAEPVEYPAAALICSGGHTALYRCDGPTKLELLGTTIDDAAGEAFDKVAAILKLGYPGGPVIDQIARTGNPKAVDFPRTLLRGQSLDFSFSGIKTAVLYHVNGVPKRGHSTFSPGRDAGLDTTAQGGGAPDSGSAPEKVECPLFGPAPADDPARNHPRQSREVSPRPTDAAEKLNVPFSAAIPSTEETEKGTLSFFPSASDIMPPSKAGSSHDVHPRARREKAECPLFVADIAASFQAAVVDVLRIKLRRAANFIGAKSLILGGGVAANTALRAGLTELAAKLRIPLRMPEFRFCLDNAAMTAGLAFHYLRDGKTDTLDLEANATVKR